LLFGMNIGFGEPDGGAAGADPALLASGAWAAPGAGQVTDAFAGQAVPDGLGGPTLPDGLLGTS